MEKNDLRKLSIPRQEAIRFRVLEALDKGMRKKDAMIKFGVSNAVIYKWLKIRSVKKDDCLNQEKRGRRSQISLTNEQEKAVKEIIINNCPDELNLPFSLWTREAIGCLLRDKFDVMVSTWTIGRYLNTWGLSPPRPIDKTKEKKSPEVKKWLKKDYPFIKERAIKENAEVQWGGEIGMRSNRLAGMIRSKKGEAAVIISSLKRFSLNMIYSHNNRGKLQFMLVKNETTSSDFDNFMSRLVKFNHRKVFLIVEHDHAHTEWTIKEWNRKNADGVELILLPS
jgi:transposase